LLFSASMTMQPTAAAKADWMTNMRPSSGIATAPDWSTINGTIWLQHGEGCRSRAASDAVELRLVVAGHAACEIDGRQTQLGAGSLLWLGSGQGLSLDGGSADFEMWVATFPALLLEQILERKSAATLAEHMRRSDQHRVIEWKDAHCIESALSRIHQARSENVYRAGLAYVVQEAWESFGRAWPHAGSGGVEDTVTAALRLLTRDPTLSREELSDRIGICPATLTRQFREQLGVTLVTYRQRLRVQRFVELGADGRYTLLDACLRAGFGSYAQCHRAFRSSLGCSPTSYFSRKDSQAVPRDAKPSPGGAWETRLEGFR
jgi:AraC-like DNA-binding protein